MNKISVKLWRIAAQIREHPTWSVSHVDISMCADHAAELEAGVAAVEIEVAAVKDSTAKTIDHIIGNLKAELAVYKRAVETMGNDPMQCAVDAIREAREEAE